MSIIGKVAFAVNSGGEPLTQLEAEARAAKANAEAESLGIKTRYEVKPA